MISSMICFARPFALLRSSCGDGRGLVEALSGGQH